MLWNLLILTASDKQYHTRRSVVMLTISASVISFQCRQRNSWDYDSISCSLFIQAGNFLSISVSRYRRKHIHIHEFCVVSFI